MTFSTSDATAPAKSKRAAYENDLRGRLLGRHTCRNEDEDGNLVDVDHASTGVVNLAATSDKREK